jgi:hypothetical protein
MHAAYLIGIYLIANRGAAESNAPPRFVHAERHIDCEKHSRQVAATAVRVAETGVGAGLLIAIAGVDGDRESRGVVALYAACSCAR